MNPTRNVSVQRWPPGPETDTVVVEEPLEIRVEGQIITLTMRTPGNDIDLATGFLWTEGIIDHHDDLHAIATIAENVVDTRLATGVPLLRNPNQRHLFASAACGLCGSTSLEHLKRRAPPCQPWQPSDALLCQLPQQLSSQQQLFGSTGGLHAAALFDTQGQLHLLREDVGRHNAVDKVLGAALREERDLQGYGLVLSSRAGFEIVQKAWMAGIPALATFGAPTSLAIETATHAGMCLIGWLRADRFVRYMIA